jgi:hypothetical protein
MLALPEKMDNKLKGVSLPHRKKSYSGIKETLPNQGIFFAG